MTRYDEEKEVQKIQGLLWGINQFIDYRDPEVVEMFVKAAKVSVQEEK